MGSVKRTRGEMEGGEAEPRDPCAAPASSLFNISMLKLHRSLRHVEPDLRHLVLVANTLRRMQGQIPEAPSGVVSPIPISGSRDSGSVPLTSSLPPSDSQGARTSQPCLGPLELLSSASYLLEDSLEDIFEDIDTSMYDCDLWSPTSLSGDRLDLSDLDYLMDVLVGGHTL
uniref:SERTA domain-containing protein n=1 Tax=Pelusios castaneus TaxID=367368 RepID=A0A8C8SX33_9SAUR